MPSDASETPTCEELACRAQLGCRMSFEELVRRHQTRLFHFLSRQLTAAEAEDVLQETFLRAYQNLHRYRPVWKFSTWLFTLANRLRCNHHRRRRPTEGAQSLDGVASAAPQPHQAAIDREGRRLLWETAAEVLSPEQYTALWLHYAEDLRVREIAKILDRSGAAIKTLLFRARRALLPALLALETGGGEPSARRPHASRAAAMETRDE